MIIIYGTKVFTKHLGYFGQKEECPVCKKTYSKSLVRYRRWAHIAEIPLIPYKTEYNLLCPICANGYHVEKNIVNSIRNNPNASAHQNIFTYAKHILAEKPKSWLEPDTSYQLWVKDLDSQEDICLASNITSDHIKDQRKIRGLKKIPVSNI